MNGSVQIKGHRNKAFQKTSEPVLTLTLTVDTVSFHDCTVQIRSSSDCHDKYLQFQSLDICSTHFSLSQATRTVSCHGDRMLCDVLLDQSVLPGVGNIIKNEALFDSGLQPSLKVLQLKEEHVKHLVKMTRDFSMLFYKCRKEGRALSRHCKVYNRQWCGQCQGRITVCRMGENGRMTYFCEGCQTRDPETIINNRRILPTKNSLIGWVTTGGHSRTDDQEWTCSVCTLINKGKAGMCSACGSPKPLPSTGRLSDTEWTCSLCTLVNDGDTKVCLVCKGPRSEPENSREQLQRVIATSNGDSVHSSLPSVPDGTPSPCNGQVSRKRELPCSSGVIVTQPTIPASGKLARLESAPLTSPSGTRVPSAAIGFNSDAAGNRLERPQHEITFHSNGSKVARATDGSNTVVCCKQHNKVCVERTARKKGDNYGRPFFCCSMPRGKQCQFFQWADDNFPLCNHGKRCVKRTVLKQGANNGKDFYTCRLERGKQCPFFQWV
ncbi:endonuclease 8-like 3 isoform X2 [Branchiostoma floridae x Branchiostoma japonicum]